jgi:hypothetical protein
VNQIEESLEDPASLLQLTAVCSSGMAIGQRLAGVLAGPRLLECCRCVIYSVGKIWLRDIRLYPAVGEGEVWAVWAEDLQLASKKTSPQTRW